MTIIPNQHLIVSRRSCAMFNCGVFTRDTHLCARDSSRQRSGARRRHGQSAGSRDASSRLTTRGRSVAVRHTRRQTQRARERAVFQSSRPIGSETTAVADDALSRIDCVAAEWRARFRANSGMSSAAARERARNGKRRRTRRDDGNRRQVFHYARGIDRRRNSISVRRRSAISYSLVVLDKAVIVSRARFGRFLALERQRRKSIRYGHFRRKLTIKPER